MSGEGSTVTVRKNDTSDSTKDYWRNGAGDHPYHRDDQPCENAPEGGYVLYEFDRINVPEDSDYCPDCDWSGTAVEEYTDPDGGGCDDCDGLPDGWPCAQCFIASESAFGDEVMSDE